MLSLVKGIPSKQLEKEWATAAPFIARALPYCKGKWSLEDVYDAIQSCDMQLWRVPGGYWVTRIDMYPQQKVLTVMFAAGEFDEWLEHGEILKAFGRAKGCSAIEINGRRGWARRLDLEVISTTCRCEL